MNHDCVPSGLLHFALELPTLGDAPRHLDDLDLARLSTRAIRSARHGFGCTAGAGCSCGGRTA